MSASGYGVTILVADNVIGFVGCRFGCLDWNLGVGIHQIVMVMNGGVYERWYSQSGQVCEWWGL